MGTVIRASGLGVTYAGPPVVHALRSATIEVHRGETVAILGPSGSGKSTLLNVLGLLDRPTDGHYELLGRDTSLCRPAELNRLRRNQIGFVFQAYHVLGRRTVRENLELKLAIARARPALRDSMVDEALMDVGLNHLADSLVQNLSGGEKQRLAIARATLGDPAVVFADEPTGNLDDENTRAVLAGLGRLSDRGIAVVVITHDHRTAEWAQHTHRLNRGVLKEAA